jgi:hypothetical protein
MFVSSLFFLLKLLKYLGLFGQSSGGHQTQYVHGHVGFPCEFRVDRD